MSDIEIAVCDVGELRVESHGIAKVITGYAIVFDRLSETLDFFREKIAPAAIDRTIKERVDLRALVGHDPDKVLGRMSAGTLRVAKDGHGLRVEVDPPKHDHGIVESIQRRDVTGMSFAFRTLKDQWDESTDPATRTIVDMLVREVSFVTFPAYPDTSASEEMKRSQTEMARRSLTVHRQGTARTTIPMLRDALERRRAAWR
jgi:HK97 family phage prohead protease